MDTFYAVKNTRFLDFEELQLTEEIIIHVANEAN